jgi:hypothetical protein
MDQILSRPEIQSAVLPFFIGLLLSIGLRKLTVSAWMWAVFAAFLVSVGLINDLTLTPLTGTRKIILLILASFFVGGFIHHLILGVNLRRSALSVYCLLGLFWVFWKVMVRMDGMAMTLSLAGAVGLVLWLLWAFDRIGNNDSQLHAAGFSLLLGTGLAATAGSSALLGQLALSLSAASGGVLLAWVINKTASTSQNSMPGQILPYALASALLGLAAVIFARVPWYTLIPLASIPLVTGFVPKTSDIRFINALVTSLPGLFIALAVSIWVWQMGSSASGY